MLATNDEIGAREQHEAARDEQFKREKELTHASDELGEGLAAGCGHVGARNVSGVVELVLERALAHARGRLGLAGAAAANDSQKTCQSRATIPMRRNCVMVSP